ncbi:MAG TPA: hypothetical protein VE153_17715 [Myxococcus sp.]|nr:hypothetical protein [Myxococcus sp.]
MKSRQESTSPGRWRELLLGGTLAGVGAPLLLKSLHRWLHLKGGASTASVGWAAGLLGALVAGRMARRRASDGEAPEPPEESQASAPPEGDGGTEDEARVVADWRREVRRRRLAALAQHAAAAAGASGPKAPPVVERRVRRGPSGREQPWHEALEATPA